MSYWSNSVVINIVLCDYSSLGVQEMKTQSLFKMTPNTREKNNMEKILIHSIILRFLEEGLPF